MSIFHRVAVSVFVPLLLGACGAPGMDIVLPATDDGTAVPDAQNQVAIRLDPAGFELAALGECGQRNFCGHLVITLAAESEVNPGDFIGTQCGGTFEASTAEFTVDLDNCERQTGVFSVLVNLHDDDHLPVQGEHVVAFRRFLVEAP